MTMRLRRTSPGFPGQERQTTNALMATRAATPPALHIRSLRFNALDVLLNIKLKEGNGGPGRHKNVEKLAIGLDPGANRVGTRRISRKRLRGPGRQVS